MDSSNDWTFTKWSVPEAVAFVEKYVADMSKASFVRE